jgi:hypothetical protein
MDVFDPVFVYWINFENCKHQQLWLSRLTLSLYKMLLGAGLSVEQMSRCEVMKIWYFIKTVLES